MIQQEKPALAFKKFNWKGLAGPATIGLSDGLILPLALSMAVCRVSGDTWVVVQITSIVIIFMALLMGIGGYFSKKNAQFQFSNQQEAHKAQSENWQETALEETKLHFENLGIEKDIQEKATNEITTSHKQWDELMAAYPNSGTQFNSSPWVTSLTIVFAYITGGFLTLLPYFFINLPNAALRYSLYLGLGSLFFFGYIKSRTAGSFPLAGAFRMVIIGLIALAGAYLSSMIMLHLK